ncbi:hypothetical protein ZHAS_00002234 [Anopheles sinensis]|uniref:Uncharacterized protein n=1 Tax=Anopheles sinensis TaxID=74873 RepID=A0A084VBZ0_ANOSI|nr:hypothetical protein ZHAS_00002234 [Anopheles sinensis]
MPREHAINGQQAAAGRLVAARNQLTLVERNLSRLLGLFNPPGHTVRVGCAHCPTPDTGEPPCDTIWLAENEACGGDNSGVICAHAKAHGVATRMPRCSDSIGSLEEKRTGCDGIDMPAAAKHGLL